MIYQLFPGDEVVIEVNEGEALVSRRDGDDLVPVVIEGPLLVTLKLPGLALGRTQRAGDDPYLGTAEITWRVHAVGVLVEEISRPAPRGVRVVGRVAEVSYLPFPMAGPFPRMEA